jgi:hypothetical protein
MNRLAVSIGRRSVFSAARFTAARSLSTHSSHAGTYGDREKFEENRFIQQEEDRRKQEARRRFEELLAKDSADAQKQDLLEALGECICEL